MRPPLAFTLMELRAPFEAAALLPAMPWLLKARKGEGHPVLVLPAFMTDDNGTYVLRNYLNDMGYQAFPWELGRNNGLRFEYYEKLLERVRELYRLTGQKVTLIGWSLGGVYARLLGHKLPTHVRQVITLGTPFRVNVTGEIAGPVAELYNRMNPNWQSDLLVNSEHIWTRPPPVPTTSVATVSDGVVGWKNCVDTAESRAPNESVRVPGSHMGLTHNALALYVVADRLANAEESEWQPFEPPASMRWLFKDLPEDDECDTQHKEATVQ